MHFKKHGHLTILIPQVTMFLDFWYFHLLCKFKILKEPMSIENFWIRFFFDIAAKLKIFLQCILCKKCLKYHFEQLSHSMYWLKINSLAVAREYQHPSNSPIFCKCLILALYILWESCLFLRGEYFQSMISLHLSCFLKIFLKTKIFFLKNQKNCKKIFFAFFSLWYEIKSIIY